jgi:putative acyl-CoA dehydrogenase
VLSVTRDVLNQPPPLVDFNPFDAYPALGEALEREGAGWAEERVRDFAQTVGSAEAIEHSRRALRNVPRLVTHDRYGNRVDRVESDPSWHWMLRVGIENGVHSLPWRDPRPGAQVAHTALFLLLNGLDTAPCCPIGVNYAAVPMLRQEPALAAEWEDRVASNDYDSYAQGGMAMTEKQGGSDLRANTTRAEPNGDGTYSITGHKWFCTIVMCDFFLTLAHAPGGLSCFLMLRDDGFRIQRLKDKLGGRALASSEVEFHGCRAWLVGDEGRGVPTIASQVNYTRLGTITGTAGILRRAVGEAVHHARHRHAFGRALADQPLMQNVLADLALESEAMTVTAMRLARAYEDPAQAAFRRLATAVEKYWVSKRAAPAAVEALECLGGNGYVEESTMPQLYRDIGLMSVWEGAGNVAALDALRVIAKEPGGLPAFLAECELARGADRRFDAHLRGLEDAFARGDLEWSARRVVEDLGVALQASLLLRHAPAAVADAFCASRLARDAGHAYGTLPEGSDLEAIVERAWRQ